ncbi:hypothetical protein SAMN05421820_103566 [Pedobacter steynii]|uniref:Uncharacterized protein n=1 Tax=Pedobacter steynii TaxID=430522 RepID=A0A1G9SDW7_9SPHI|nr:hypothetical protein [Pedobacter steynii]SDM33668.1 hypothetical protein SAMN05421820_103566 [Pedobacter steynii]
MNKKTGIYLFFSGNNTYSQNDKYLIFKLTLHISFAKFKFIEQMPDPVPVH